MASNSYLIVGAGVFGVSTAYHLIQKYPSASVTIVDRDAYDAESRVAASWDWNKVVRADYDDIVYCSMGIEAQDVFKSDPLWKPFFHETGIYWMCRSDYAQDVIDNYKKLGRKADLKAVSIEEAKKLYNGLFEDADYTDVKEVLINKTSGWAAAGDCLRAVTKRCLELGVKYVVAEVATLQFDGRRRCVGIKTASGNVLKASHVILSTGAYTPKLLELSAKATGITELRSEDRILAGGITTGMTKLDDKSYERFASMPVGVQGYTAKQGPFIGSLPPTADRELKWWGQTIFRNTKEVLPGRFISMPPPEKDYAQWKVSGKLKEDIDYANHVFYGKNGATWKMEKHRICWDAFTTSSDFIISPHAASQGLVFLKLDNLQPAGSFKSRGIGNYIVHRAAERHGTPNTHFYAASGGNAGIACVHAARMLGYPATVVVPRTAKPIMIKNLYAMGATEVIQQGASIAEAQEHIQKVILPNDPNGVFVPPFDHPDIWEGNATIMREIVDQLGDKPDVVVCSIGGGGLMNGIMQVIDEKGWTEDVQVVATETDGADSLSQALQAGELITLPRITSQATSLGVVRVSQKTFDYAQRPNVTSIVFSDAEAAQGCCLLAEHHRMMVELTVGVNIPLCYQGLLQKILGSKKVIDSSSKVVIVVCGGNDINVEMLMAWREAMLSKERESIQDAIPVTVQPASTSVAA